MSILFHGESHRARADLARGDVRRAGGVADTDRRIIWYGLSLIGWLLALVAAAPMLGPKPQSRRPAATLAAWIGLPVSAVAAKSAAGGWLNGADPVDLRRLDGGGRGRAVVLIAGVLWLPFLWPLRRPRLGDLAWAGGFLWRWPGLRRDGALCLAALVADARTPVALAAVGAGLPALVSGRRVGAAWHHRRRSSHPLVAGAKRCRGRWPAARGHVGALARLSDDPAAGAAGGAGHFGVAANADPPRLGPTPSPAWRLSAGSSPRCFLWRNSRSAQVRLDHLAHARHAVE